MIGVLSLVVTVALYTIELTWHSPPCGHGGLLALQLHVSDVLSSFLFSTFMLWLAMWAFIFLVVEYDIFIVANSLLKCAKLITAQ